MPSPAYSCLHCGRTKLCFDKDWRMCDDGLMCPVCYLLLHYIIDDPPSVQKVLPKEDV